MQRTWVPGPTGAVESPQLLKERASFVLGLGFRVYLGFFSTGLKQFLKGLEAGEIKTKISTNKDNSIDKQRQQYRQIKTKYRQIKTKI